MIANISKRCRRCATLLVFGFLIIWGSNTSNAAPLHYGDVVAAIQNSGALYDINQNTGVTLIRSGGLLYNPFHVIVDKQGLIYNSERTTGRVVRTDPATGIQTTLTTIN